MQKVFVNGILFSEFDQSVSGVSDVEKANAEIAGIQDETGSIEAGKSADFIVCKDDPIENIEALKNLEFEINSF